MREKSSCPPNWKMVKFQNVYSLVLVPLYAEEYYLIQLELMAPCSISCRGLIGPLCPYQVGVIYYKKKDIFYMMLNIPCIFFISLPKKIVPLKKSLVNADPTMEYYDFVSKKMSDI